ncbi:hypothetical protein ACFYWX_30770 [Streptomyces sp. NPDC002888]|uniref:hypothetical protein n=1 Tax=Streptomyces sp. NPDC002888 TaxID=3364668 RepID=UPI00367EBF64
MTAHAMENPVVRRPETGWARAQRLRGKSVRTWISAVDGRTAASSADRTGPEWNIVRGED